MLKINIINFYFTFIIPVDINRSSQYMENVFKLVFDK